MYRHPSATLPFWCIGATACGGYGAQDGGAHGVARKMWRAECGAQNVACTVWRAWCGAQDVARKMWRAGCGVQVLTARRFLRNILSERNH